MDKIYEAYKNSGNEQIAEAKKIDNKELRDIAVDYDKMFSEHFNSVEKQLTDARARLMKHRGQLHWQAMKLFGEFNDKMDKQSAYKILNGIFGPNEINRDEETYRFSVKSQSKKLEALEQKFKKAFDSIISGTR